MSANITGGWTLEFGVKARSGAAIESIGTFVAAPGVRSIQVAFDANTRATKQIRFPDASFSEAIAEARSAVLPPGGKPPALTPLFGYTFCKKAVVRAVEPSCALDTSVSPQFDANLAQFMEWFPLSDTSGGLSDENLTPYGDLKRKRGYWEARNYISDLTSLEARLANMSAVAEDILVVSMGDEISLKVPRDPATAQALFVAWCAARKVAVPGTFNTSWNGNAKIFWYSSLFSDEYVIKKSLARDYAAIVRFFLPLEASPLQLQLRLCEEEATLSRLHCTALTAAPVYLPLSLSISLSLQLWPHGNERRNGAASQVLAERKRRRQLRAANVLARVVHSCGVHVPSEQGGDDVPKGGDDAAVGGRLQLAIANWDAADVVDPPRSLPRRHARGDDAADLADNVLHDGACPGEHRDIVAKELLRCVAATGCIACCLRVARSAMHPCA